LLFYRYKQARKSMEFAIGAQELTNGEQDKAAQDKVFQES
jgi:hypothetical protein